MAQHNELGAKGEEIAREFLVEKGYKILELNWRYDHLELDIIAQEKDDIVIVEVKSRTDNTYEEPYEAVSKKKQRSMVIAADAYIQQNEIDLETRFDVISIVFRGSGYELQHFEEAFYPSVG